MSSALLDIQLTDADAEAALRADARAGLTATPKQLPPKWFYDARGSELFEQITELPEYYPTRTERALLRAHACDDIAAALRRGHPRRAGVRLVGQDPAAARRVPPSRHAAPLRAAGRQRGGAAAGPATRWPRSTRGWRCTAWSATSPGTWTGCPAGRRGGWSPSSAAPSATCCPPSGRRSSASCASVLEPGEQLLLGTAW